MRRVVLLALLLLALPMAVWADPIINIGNANGSINASVAGGLYTLGLGSHLNSFSDSLDKFSLTKPGMGYVSFGTGAFSGTSLFQNGTFSSSGSWFDVTSVGTWVRGLPGLKSAKGHVALFTGAFDSPITWQITSKPSGAHGTWTFQLSGSIKGTLWNGYEAYGTTQQTLYSSTNQWTNGIGHIKLGTSTVTGSPEPGTLGLLGTGLIGIAGLVRRKRSA